jgi:hydrogenase maturation protease
MRTVIFGVGNPDRGDDAAGWLVADLLGDGDGEALTVRRVTADPSAILTDPLWDAADHVVIVDAVRTGAPPGTVHRWDLFELCGAPSRAGGGTHDLGIATTIALAGALGRLPLAAVVIGIEGGGFDPGAPPSPEVLAASERVAAALEIGVLGAEGPELVSPGGRR